MKRNAKIIQITGIRGIIMAIFIVTCLAAGFVAFPGLVAMHIWNHFAGEFLPEINLYQGILLWAIVAITGFILNKQSFSVSFESPKELNEEELNLLMERIRMQSQAKMLNKMMLKNLEEIKKDDKIEATEIAEMTEAVDTKMQETSKEELISK